MTIGICWKDGHKATRDEVRLLKTSLGSFVRRQVKVAALPSIIGAFTLGTPTGKTRWILLDGALVGWLVDDPNPQTGIPSDAHDVSQLDYIDPPTTKPKLESREPAGFGWDPGYGDD